MLYSVILPGMVGWKPAANVLMNCELPPTAHCVLWCGGQHLATGMCGLLLVILLLCGISMSLHSCGSFSPCSHVLQQPLSHVYHSAESNAWLHACLVAPAAWYVIATHPAAVQKCREGCSSFCVRCACCMCSPSRAGLGWARPWWHLHNLHVWRCVAMKSPSNTCRALAVVGKQNTVNWQHCEAPQQQHPLGSQ